MEKSVPSLPLARRASEEFPMHSSLARRANRIATMKLGLITDIHEHVEHLRRALAEFDRRGVERILCIGDVVETGQQLHETVALLAERGIAGVWGNHDFGLCSHPSALVSTRRAKFAGPVLDYLATYQP